MPDIFALNATLFVLGLVIIIVGSNLFLDSAIWFARASGLSQLVIGATVVSLCTTIPEVVSSATASLKGAADMALGNAIGSVICNTMLILGVVLLFTVAKIHRERFLVKGICLLVALAAAVVVALPWGGNVLNALRGGGGQVFRIGRAEGLLLLFGLVAYLFVNYLEAKHERAGETVDDEAPARPAATVRDWLRSILLFLAGGAMLAVGAYLLIEFGQRIARGFGVSEAVISLVFVAFGTSLPEMFTAIGSLRKGVHDISVGNIMGANVLNIFFVTGLAATLNPLQFADSYLIRLDIPFAFVVTVLLFGIGLKRGRIGRGMGIALLVGYVGYLASLFLLGRVGAP
ncbi:MAG: calcium/sodium antiporter [Lentisphaeria bacterium]|jgi:cation:H+ antiporter|nr:calcium/sodium antiporter [Lentisphaeria bacterium]